MENLDEKRKEETRLDRRTGPRNEDDGTQEDFRWENSQEVETI
jgi:hypothetical protein